MLLSITPPIGEPCFVGVFYWFVVIKISAVIETCAVFLASLVSLDVHSEGNTPFPRSSKAAKQILLFLLGVASYDSMGTFPMQKN